MNRFWFFLFLFLSSAAAAQKPTIDPYRWITDPLAIADLGGADSLPITRYFTGDHTRGELDADGQYILAADTGTGILRHLWCTLVTDTQHVRLKLWVDDSLLIDAPANEFFGFAHGDISEPLSQKFHRGLVSEMQIPYHRSFRWTSSSAWYWRNCEWQRIDTSVARLPKIGEQMYRSALNRAVSQYSVVNPWSGGTAGEVHSLLKSGETLQLPVANGPGFVQNIHLTVEQFDTTTLRNLWIVLNWDGSSHPSIEMPVAAFFGVSQSLRFVQSFRFQVDTTAHALDCFFPMPFRTSCAIQLINKGSTPANVSLGVTWASLDWSRDYGYFGADYHTTAATAWNLRHPVLHRKGRGRYVGIVFGFANSPFTQAVFMEGNGYFSVDSIPRSTYGLSPEYSGVEDYCNSGWYFDSVTYSFPFGGNSPRWGNMYRFHISDPYNYTSSFDLDWGHGFNDDYKETINTVAYYYEHRTPFEISTDTLAVGSTLVVQGSAYQPGEVVRVYLDSSEITSTRANERGELLQRITARTEWVSRGHVVRVNTETWPHRLAVVARPVVTFLQDSAGRTFSERDSIEVRGYGFPPSDRIVLYLGQALPDADTPFDNSTNIRTDSNGIFRVKAFLPWVPQGKYRLVAVQSDGSRNVSDSVLYVTRMLNYEFEDLHVAEGVSEYAYLSFPTKHWSQASIAFCYGNWRRGNSVGFSFDVPFADSFAVRLFGTLGQRYAIYRTYIDSIDCGLKDWFLDIPFPGVLRDSVDLPMVYLNAGSHVIRFVNEGWTDGTVEYSVGPDNIEFFPQSESTRALGPKLSVPGAVSIYPNPLVGRVLFVKGVPARTAAIVLRDILGRTILTRNVIDVQDIRLELPSVAAGVYWLEFVGSGSARVVVP